MFTPERFRVLVLPQHKIVAEHLTLREASAYVRTYNYVMRSLGKEAVIAQQRSDEKRGDDAGREVAGAVRPRGHEADAPRKAA